METCYWLKEDYYHPKWMSSKTEFSCSAIDLASFDILSLDLLSVNASIGPASVKLNTELQKSDPH